MARPLRIEYEGALYHVTSRGNEGRSIFFSKSDYHKFLGYLETAQEKYHCLIHAYVLMNNHFHLLIETLLPNLNQVMHYLNGSYTNFINLRRGHRGHLLQGRYKAILVDRDNYLLEVSRYLHLNPVRARIVKMPEDYPYSSYRAYISKSSEEIIYRDLILGMISNNQRKAVNLYKNFVEKAIGIQTESPLKNIYGGIILGNQEFIRDTLYKLEDDVSQKKGISHGREFKKQPDVQEIIDKVSTSLEASPNEIFENRNKLVRDIAIYLIKRYTGLTNKQIGERLGNISDFAVAKIYQRFLEKLKKDEILEKKVAKAAERLSNVKP